MLSIFLSFCLLLSCIPGMNVMVLAEQAVLSSTSYEWNSDCTIYSDVTINGAVTVKADVTLTIPRGKTLTVNGGIRTDGSSQLTVSGAGTMNVTGQNSAGIAGSIIVNGAAVTVTGGDGGYGVQNATLNSGSLTVYGGSGSYGCDYLAVNSGTAKVYGGNGGDNLAGGTGCDILEVNGGIVEVYGGNGGNGTGGNPGGAGGLGCRKATILQGTVEFYGGNGGDGSNGGEGGLGCREFQSVIGAVKAKGGNGGNGVLGGNGGIGCETFRVEAQASIEVATAEISGGNGGTENGKNAIASPAAITNATAVESNDGTTWNVCSKGYSSEKQYVKIGHFHSFSYALNETGDTIRLTCADDNCYYKRLGMLPSLTIAAPALENCGGSESEEAIITDTALIRGKAAVSYYKANDDDTRGDALESAPTDAGKYWAEITLGEDGNTATAHVVYTINNPEYAVTIQSAENGTVLADKEKAVYGEEVTLTAEPSSDDYILRSYIVKDANDNEVAVTGGKFTMPASAVTVTALFDVKHNAKAALNVVMADDQCGSASLLNGSFLALSKDEQIREGDKFLLRISSEEDYDYHVAFSSGDDPNDYMEKVSEDKFEEYLSYCRENAISVPSETYLFWVTMPYVESGDLTITVTFAKAKTFTILYQHGTGDPERMWSKYTTTVKNVETDFTVEMNRDIKLNGVSVWSAKVKATFEPQKIAFVTSETDLENAEMTDAPDSIQRVPADSDWNAAAGSSNSKFVVIGGNAKTVIAAFVADPDAVSDYDRKTATYHYAENQDGVTYEMAVCVTDGNGTVTTAGTVTAPKGPEKANCDFEGWRGLGFDAIGDKATERIYAANDSIQIRENTTFHAVLHYHDLQITQNLNGGTGGNTVTSVAYMTTLPDLGTPTKDGYAFNGWKVSKSVTENGVYFAKGAPFDLSTPITADLKLTAQWKHVHSYSCHQISSFGTKLEMLQKYEEYLHVEYCSCGAVTRLTAHTFDSSGKCACGYQKPDPVLHEVRISFAFEDLSWGIISQPVTVEENEVITCEASTNFFSNHKLSKWQYKTEGSTTWKDLTTSTMAALYVPCNVELRAYYELNIKPAVSLEVLPYDVETAIGGNQVKVADMLFKLYFQLPKDCTFIDAGIKLGDNDLISYYRLVRDIDYRRKQTYVHYESREDNALNEINAKTLGDCMYQGKPVNAEKYPPFYWEGRTNVIKNKSGTYPMLVPLAAAQENDGNHYIYGIAYMHYKDKNGTLQTLHTAALAATLNHFPDNIVVKVGS